MQHTKKKHTLPTLRNSYNPQSRVIIMHTYPDDNAMSSPHSPGTLRSSQDSTNEECYETASQQGSGADTPFTHSNFLFCYRSSPQADGPCACDTSIANIDMAIFTPPPQQEMPLQDDHLSTPTKGSIAGTFSTTHSQLTHCSFSSSYASEGTIDLEGSVDETAPLTSPQPGTPPQADDQEDPDTTEYEEKDEPVDENDAGHVAHLSRHWSTSPVVVTLSRNSSTTTDRTLSRYSSTSTYNSKYGAIVLDRTPSNCTEFSSQDIAAAIIDIELAYVEAANNLLIQQQRATGQYQGPPASPGEDHDMDEAFYCWIYFIYLFICWKGGRRKTPPL